MALDKTTATALQTLLATMGGGGAEVTADRFKDTKIERVGATITIPEGMTYDEALVWIKRRKDEDEKKVQPNEIIEGFPLDAAYALQLAVHERYGFFDARSIPGFFGSQPPSFMATPIDHLGNTVDVFTGRFGIPGLRKDDFLQTYPTEGHDGIHVVGKVAQALLPEVKALCELTRKTLQSRSLYKGKAISLDYGVVAKGSFGAEDTQGFVSPTFLTPIDPNQELILNDDTYAIISALVWGPIRNAELMRQKGIPLKRGYLASGPYGTGKSLFAAMTASIATQNGFTFVHLRDGSRLADAYKFAARYAPAVLFAEDLDALLKTGNINVIQNTLDGVDTKANEVMLIVTTNFEDEVDPSLMRPGRIDTLLSFDNPNPGTCERLVRYYAGADLSAGTDISGIGQELAGMSPAVIAEVVKSAKLANLAMFGEMAISRESLQVSATQLRRQNAMINRPPKKRETAYEQLGRAFGQAMLQAGVTVDRIQSSVDPAATIRQYERSNKPLREEALKPKYEPVSE